MSKILVLNPFTLDADAHSDAHGFATEGESLTVQADLEQSDINNIIRSFGITGELRQGSITPAAENYADFPTDYHTAMNMIKELDSAFYDLPAEHRSMFDNDTGKFMDFVNDPSNRDKAIKLGYIDPPPPPVNIQPEPALDFPGENG